ncbi:uncharacterized protein [Nicotiana tomentosiformis]|uniref:uncharacterized protein n=1 Tax=Nicotiana tomentosiformis TaxID=4098 RepID=UPI00388C5594
MKALSKIGSALRNPVYADDCTTGSVRISYARMLIEIDITKPLPRRVKMQDPTGKTIEQEISYDWEPTYCNKCLKIGHNCNENRIQQPRKMAYQGRVNKGKQVWQRTNRDGSKDNKQEKKQTKKPGTIKPPENGPMQVAIVKKLEEARWITVSGKSSARMAKAKQVEKQTLAGSNGFQSLGSDQAINEPGTSSMQMRSYGVQELGLNKAYKQKEIKEFIKENKKAVIALVEHRIKEQKASCIIKKIAPGWQWLSNYSNNNKSRIWVIWDPRIFVFEPTEIDEQIIHWQIRTHSKIHSLQQGPWLAMRDFNAVLNGQDRHHVTMIQDMETKDFREFMNDTEMNELHTVGRDYT